VPPIRTDVDETPGSDVLRVEAAVATAALTATRATAAATEDEILRVIRFILSRRSRGV
jgi:hypothetical protein